MFCCQEPSAIYHRTAPSSAQQSANIRQDTERFKLSQTHRRHIGDILNMCKHRRCVFDVMISRIIWMIHRRCSRTGLRSIGDAMAMAIFSISTQKYANRTKVMSSFSTISCGSHKICCSRLNLPIFYIRIADVRLSHAEGSPTIADSKSTSLTVSRCNAD